MRDKTKKKISEKLKGIVWSKEALENRAKSLRGLKRTPEQKEHFRQVALALHRKLSPESIARRTENRRKNGWNKSPKKDRGENHWNWQGGKSFEPYGLEYNDDLKEVIRNRDRRKCFMCEKIELENKEKLTVHHIDYNKQNNNPNNLISLCRKCHSKTSFKREYWTNYFKE